MLDVIVPFLGIFSDQNVYFCETIGLNCVQVRYVRMFMSRSLLEHLNT